MTFEHEMKIAFEKEDCNKYPLLSNKHFNNNNNNHFPRYQNTIQKEMALDMLYQLFLYYEIHNKGHFWLENIHEMYAFSPSPSRIESKFLKSEASKCLNWDILRDRKKDRKKIIAFLTKHIPVTDINFPLVMIKVILKTIEVKDFEMFTIIWFALDVMTIYDYVTSNREKAKEEVKEFKGKLDNVGISAHMLIEAYEDKQTGRGNSSRFDEYVRRLKLADKVNLKQID